MWTEEYIQSIPREDHRVERKSSLLLDFSGIGNEGKARDEVAKQLSAFANSGGGSVILGVDNQGNIDGGIPATIRGRQSTKEWLEDIIPQLTEPEIVGFQVLDIKPQTTQSAIARDKAVYVIEVPNSDRAPHQSTRDQRYYVRLGGKSQPASHQLIEDIRNRAKHPKLEMQKVRITDASYRAHGDTDGCLDLCVEMSIDNLSGVRAANVSVELSTNTTRGLEGHNLVNGTWRQGAKPGRILLDLNGSFYPNMEIAFSVAFGLSALYSPPVPTLRGSLFTIDGHVPEEVMLMTTIYADSAPKYQQEFSLSEMDVNQKLSEEIRRLGWEWLHPPDNRPINLGRRRRRY